MIKNILCLQVFSLNFFKFDLYLLKQSIFRVLKRHFEQEYLMIVGLSSYFTSCYWCFNFLLAHVKQEFQRVDAAFYQMFSILICIK